MTINVIKRGLIDTALHRKDVPAKTFCSGIGGQLILSSTTNKQQLTDRSSSASKGKRFNYQLHYK